MDARVSIYNFIYLTRADIGMAFDGRNENSFLELIEELREACSFISSQHTCTKY
jgi:hypothetical protein